MTNQVTVITGGSRGVGRAVALRMAAETNILVVGKNCSKELDELKSKLGEVKTLLGDVADPDTAKRAAKVCSDAGWAVQNLILNAGISESGPTATFEEATWRKLFDVNVHGAFNFVKEFLPAMVTQKSGTICFVPGTAGVKGYRNMAGYCASKHALLGFARSLALEVGSKGVTVASVAPGPVDTDMTGTLVNMLVGKGMTVDKAKAKIGEDNPQKRLLLPEEVADVIARICNKTLTCAPGEPVIFSEALVK